MSQANLPSKKRPISLLCQPGSIALRASLAEPLIYCAKPSNRQREWAELTWTRSAESKQTIKKRIIWTDPPLWTSRTFWIIRGRYWRDLIWWTIQTNSICQAHIIPCLTVTWRGAIATISLRILSRWPIRPLEWAWVEKVDLCSKEMVLRGTLPTEKIVECLPFKITLWLFFYVYLYFQKKFLLFILINWYIVIFPEYDIHDNGLL